MDNYVVVDVETRNYVRVYDKDGAIDAVEFVNDIERAEFPDTAHLTHYPIAAARKYAARSDAARLRVGRELGPNQTRRLR